MKAKCIPLLCHAVVVLILVVVNLEGGREQQKTKIMHSYRRGIHIIFFLISPQKHILWVPLRKQAYSNILKNLPPKMKIFR